MCFGTQLSSLKLMYEASVSVYSFTVVGNSERLTPKEPPPLDCSTSSMLSVQGCRASAYLRVKKYHVDRDMVEMAQCSIRDGMTFIVYPCVVVIQDLFLSGLTFNKMTMSGSLLYIQVQRSTAEDLVLLKYKSSKSSLCTGQNMFTTYNYSR